MGTYLIAHNHTVCLRLGSWARGGSDVLGQSIVIGGRSIHLDAGRAPGKHTLLG